jgi:hypothetical protein
MNFKSSLLALATLFCVSQSAQAGLVGTELTLSSLLQSTALSQQFTSSFPRVATVSATEVEYPNVASLFNPNDPKPPNFGSIVNTWIDAGDNYIEIDFDLVQSGRFASGFENTYVFQFDSIAAATITGASINTAVTTLGLSPSDVRFSGNRLFVNVEGLTFNTSSFARIDLTVEGGPAAVPEPQTSVLVAAGLLVFAGISRRQRK